MNDTPRRWRNILDKALRTRGMIPHELIGVASYCIRYSGVSELGNTGGSRSHRTGERLQKTPSLDHMSNHKEAAFEKTLDPIAGSPGQSVAGNINLFVDDLFGTGGNEMEQSVLTRPRKDSQVGSEDWNDVTFTRQRIRCTQDKKSLWNEARRKSTTSIHTMYRSLLGQISWLQKKRVPMLLLNFQMLRWQLLQHLAMLSLSTNWRDRSSHTH